MRLNFIVGIDAENKTFKVECRENYRISIIGDDFPVTYYAGDIYFIDSVEKAKELGFKEDISTFSWYNEEMNIPKTKIHDKYHYFKFNNQFMNDSTTTYLLSEGKKYSFGVEYECSFLNLPRYIWKNNNLNCSCVRDGSLNAGKGGPEIITSVLTGDNGMQELKKICYYLTTRGKVDKYCGMHLHIGGFDFSKENIVYLFKLSKIIEEEIFQIVPPSRRNNEYCRKLDNLHLSSNIKNQNYNDYKIALDLDINQIMTYIAHSGTPKISRKGNHPLGPKCGYNHSTPRYCWINFVPAVFNTRGSEESKTIEIRIHSGTTNYTKTKNWLLLWMGVIWYVENKKYDINENTTLETILTETYPKKGRKILNYFNERRKLFNEYSENNNEDSTEYQESVDKINSIKEEICV